MIHYCYSFQARKKKKKPEFGDRLAIPLDELADQEVHRVIEDQANRENDEEANDIIRQEMVFPTDVPPEPADKYNALGERIT